MCWIPDFYQTLYNISVCFKHKVLRLFDRSHVQSGRHSCHFISSQTPDKTCKLVSLLSVTADSVFFSWQPWQWRILTLIFCLSATHPIIFSQIPAASARKTTLSLPCGCRGTCDLIPTYHQQWENQGVCTTGYHNCVQIYLCTGR